MAVAGAPESLKDQLELEDDVPIAYDTAVRVTSQLKVENLKTADYYEMAKRKVPVSSLCVNDPSAGAAKTPVTHLLDLIFDVEDTFDKQNIVALCKGKSYGQSPAPFCPKEPIAFTFRLNICVLERDGEGDPKKIDILKHFIFENKPTLEVALKVIQGHAKLINFGKNKRAGAKQFFYLWHRLGGFQVCDVTIKAHNMHVKELQDEGEVNKGYDHIMKHKHLLTKRGLQLNRWIDIETQREGSPILGWNGGKVRQAWADLKEADCQAEPEHEYPLYLKHLQPWFHGLLLKHMRRFNEEALFLVGTTGAGNTTVQYIVGLGMARFRTFPPFSLDF